MNELDVIVIGGYDLADDMSVRALDSIRLSCNGHHSSVAFLRELIASGGDIAIAERNFLRLMAQEGLPSALNLIYLLDFLRSHAIRAEGISFFRYQQAEFRALMSCKPKVAAISTTFITKPEEICRIAGSIREISPETTIVAGGTKILKSYRKYQLWQRHYFDGFDEEAMKKLNFFFHPETDRDIDFFIVEENGELTLLELIRRLQEGRDPYCVPNLAHRKNGVLEFTRRVEEPDSFASNFLDWKHVDRRNVGFLVPVRSGSGCPYRCGFCDFAGLHKKTCFKPIEGLVRELRLISESFPGKTIFFTDDNLFINKRRTKEICTAIINSGLKIRWRGFMRTDSVTDETIDLIVRSGCEEAYLGIESGDDGILANMHKKERRADAVRAVNLLNACSVNTLLTLLVGFPGETHESIDNTISLLNGFDSRYTAHRRYYPFIFILAPLSPVASPANRLRFKISGGFDAWSHESMDSTEARAQLQRLFDSTVGCSVAYLENSYGFPLSLVSRVSFARDALVKSGINIINEHTATRVYDTFRPIFQSAGGLARAEGREAA